MTGTLTPSGERKSTNDLFAAFLPLTERTNGWLRGRVRSVCGYPAEVLVDRLTQRVIEIAILPYTLVAHASLRSTGTFPGAGTRVTCPGASVDVGSGGISVTPAQLVGNLVTFAQYWGYCLFSIVRAFFSRRVSPPAVLVVDFSDEHLFTDGRDDRFVDYCRRGPLTPLRSAKRILVVTSLRHTSSRPDLITYCRHPLLRLLQEAPLGLAGCLHLLFSHLRLFWSFLFTALKAPEVSLIAKEIAYSSIARALDRAGLIDHLILTCSVWEAQALWMRSLSKTTVHMIWYSQATQSATYVSDQIKSEAPQIKWIRVDTHWVWTHAFANLLRTGGQQASTIEVVGPIVWCLPPDTAATPSGDVLTVLVFDVPAIGDDVMLMLGEISNNFHPDRLKAFVRDIVVLKTRLENACKRPVVVRWKMKRGYRDQYVREYFDFIQDLAARGVLSLHEPRDNIYEIISASDLVIGYPWTSPVYVAEWLGVPSIYYDATQDIVQEFYADSDGGVCFVSGLDELSATAVRLIQSGRGFARPDVLA